MNWILKDPQQNSNGSIMKKWQCALYVHLKATEDSEKSLYPESKDILAHSKCSVNNCRMIGLIPFSPNQWAKG